MGLLTLIVTGEGIIGSCRATSLTNEGVGATSRSPTLSGRAISGILRIYLLYFGDEPNYVYSTVLGNPPPHRNPLCRRSTTINDPARHQTSPTTFSPKKPQRSLLLNRRSCLTRDSDDATFIGNQIDKLRDLCAYAIFSGCHIEAPADNDQW